MVQAQAMACGLPVICTTNTGGADLVRDGRDGFILPIRDVDALKEKILYFYENPGACQEYGGVGPPASASRFYLVGLRQENDRGLPETVGPG